MEGKGRVPRAIQHSEADLEVAGIDNVGQMLR